MKNPKVTVLMSVYNGEKYLNEAIDSILRQTFKDFEFLIVNDGSTDKTGEILKSYNDPRIKIIDNEKNIGLTRSLNIGLRIAKGEYIARQDADDISMPERLEKELSIIENNSEIIMVACWIKIIDENSNKIRFWQADIEYNSPEEIYYTLFFENCIAHSTVLFDKELVLKIGGYNESFQKSQDYELWSRLSKIGKIIKIKENLVIRREHNINTLHNVVNQHKINEERLFLKNINTFLSNKLNLYTLLSIKYNNSSWRIGESNILIMLNTLNKINMEIVKNAPSFLERKKLKRCIKNKRNKMIKKSFPSVLGIFKFVVKCLLFVPRYFLEYAVFFFTFKRKCSRLKVSEDKKYILCIIPYMVVGGAERVILNIAKAFEHEKYSFHCITTVNANHVWFNKFYPYFQNIIIPSRSITVDSIFNRYFDLLIRKLNINVVLISNSLIGYKYLPKLKSTFKHIKAVDILHTRESFGIKPELKWVIPYLDKRVCISKDLKEYMVEVYKTYEIKNNYSERVKIIYNGIDIDIYNSVTKMKGKFKSKYRIPHDTKLISFIGRFSYEKNPFLFVDIVKKVIEKNSNNKLKFVMSGNGPESEKIKNYIREYNIENYFIQTGFIDNTVELLADTYILLVVSKSEGIPFVVLESMSMKVIVISNNVGAIQEIIKDGENGYLINLNDNIVESFSNKIINLLNNADEYKQISRNARKTIDSMYTLKNMGNKYKDLFEDLCKK